MKWLIPPLIFVLLTMPAYAQDFDRGLAAAELGDYETALREWRPLAAQGFAEAQYYLGSMYEKGIGVQQDFAEAAKWYRRAADQDDTDGQNNLGAMYLKGNGMRQDIVRAYMWFSLAAAKDHRAAIANRDFVVTQMTPEQKTNARRMALSWAKKHRQ